MIDQTEKNNVLVEIIGWVISNILSISLVGLSLYFSSTASITSNTLGSQIIEAVAIISLLGGGILIAGSQWVFLRHLHPQIAGGGWAWIISGVLSSIFGSCVVGLSVLGFGDYPTEKDYLLFVVLLVSEQVIFLSIVEGFILRANKYKKVGQWVIINISGYGLAVIFLFIFIPRWAGGFGVLIFLATFSMVCASAVSGWGLIRVLESRDDSRVNNSIQEAKLQYSNADFIPTNLEKRGLHGQNFDGADFRKTNLRMANLEDVSCEPVRVKKMGPGWFYLFLGALGALGGNASGSSPDLPLSVVEMKSTNFSEADLSGASLKRAKLREADFRKAILRNANLSEAILVNATLSEADLRDANFSNADMSGALFYKANLKGADLTGAKLDGADFDGASLENAILRNADLREVKYLSKANLTGADLSGAIMPEEE